MKAVTVSKTGTDTQLTFIEQPKSRPEADEALVRVKAISLNNGEVRGALQEGTAGDQLGWDLSGIVEAAPVHSGFRAGDRVVGLVWGGAWAEYVTVPLDRLAKIPENVSFEMTATLPVAGLTAAIALQKRVIGAGSRVLVTTATGGVGTHAIQLAALTGAHVTALTRDASQREFLRELGATEVAIGSLAAEAAGPFDLILEGVGGALLGEALMWLAPRGVCVLFGDAADDKLTTFDARRFRLQSGGAFGGTALYGFFLVEELGRPDRLASGSRILTDLASEISAGRLQPVIGRSASWTEIDAMSRALLRREFAGKAVLTVS